MSENLPASDGQEEDFSKYQTDKGMRLRWLKEIELVKNSKARRAFEKIGEKIVKIYRNQLALDGSLRNSDSSISKIMFNILWSNVQILKPALFARLPKVVVERRFKDTDSVGRLASLIAERCSSFMMDANKNRYTHAIRSAVEDRLLPGLGVVWPRYDTEFQDLVDEMGMPMTDEAGEPLQEVKPNSEKVMWDYVFWQDYFWAACRNPYEKRWEAKRVYMTRTELIKLAGEEIGRACRLEHNPNSNRSKLSDDDAQFLGQAVVYEIHEKATKMIFWVSSGYEKGCLKCQRDVLNLKGFFPCPVPLLATTTTDSMYPTPDYVIYEALANELENVTGRIRNLIECVRMVGITSSALYDKMKNILKLKDGDLWPADNWTGFVEKGGFKGAIDWIPFDQAVAALQPLLAQQQNLMGLIDLITGIPDLLRGSTDPNETASAIQKKSHWMTLKMNDRQADVQRFACELIEKTAEIIFEPGLFHDDTISLMCGAAQMTPDDQAIYPEALQLLRDDRLNTFRVDIETDSTLAQDEQAEQAAWGQYMQTVQGAVSEIQAISQFQPELMHPIIESAKAAVRSLRTGRSVEGAWDSAWQKIEDRLAEQAAQPPAPPPPDPQLLRAQNEAEKNQIDAQIAQTKQQIEIQKAQEDLQIAMQELQLKIQDQQFTENLESQKFALDAQKLQMDFEIKSQDVQIKGLAVQSKAQVDQMAQQLDAAKEAFNQTIDAQVLEIEKYKTVLDEKEKLLTEVRLQKEEQLNTAKFAHEHLMALKQHELDLAASQVSSKASESDSAKR